MSQRLNYLQHSSDLFKKLGTLSAGVKASGLEAGLLHLIDIRASQLNGCGFCLDMHVKEAKLHGERELRLHHVAIWRESPLFSARERAALAWTEALTRIGEHGVSDEIYALALEQFSEKELSDLSFAVSVINAWNRINVGFRTVPGSMDGMLGLNKAGLA